MRAELIQLLAGHEELAALDPAARRLALRSIVHSSASDERVPALVGELSDWIDGFGPLTSLMDDPEVTDVLVNAPDEVWVERSGCLEKAPIQFASSADVMDLIERLLGSGGIRVDASQPIADVRLRDGSRLHVVLPPVSGTHPLLSIRTFPARAFCLDALADRGFITGVQKNALAAAVDARRTLIVAGGTGAGKTTLINALLGRVGGHERVVVVEETPELFPVCRHWVSLTARPANIEGRGAVDQSALLRAALRMRPDRIVVGEVRGPEALIALQAMATGHEGSMLTVHARSAADVTERLVDLASMAARSPSDGALRRRVETAVDMVVQVARIDGARRVVEIVER